MSTTPPVFPPNGQVTERAHLGPGRPVLVARIHTQRAKGWPKRGKGLTTEELLPEPVFRPDDTPKEVAHKQAQQRARESSIAVFGTTLHHPLPPVPPGWTGSLQVPDCYSAEHWGGWLRIVAGDAVPVATLPAGLLDRPLADAVEVHRTLVADYLTRLNRVPAKRPVESPSAASILGALLPDVNTLALSVGRPDQVPDARASARFRAARLVAGVSMSQLEGLVGLSAEQVSRFEANTEDLSGKYLPMVAWALFPDKGSKRQGVPKTLAITDLTKAQQMAYDWILRGGRPWWWVRAFPTESADIGDFFGLPSWSRPVLGAFTGWLWSVMTPEQQQLLGDHRAVPEVDVDGKVALRRFTAYQLRPLLHTAEVKL